MIQSAGLPEENSKRSDSHTEVTGLKPVEIEMYKFIDRFHTPTKIVDVGCGAWSKFLAMQAKFPEVALEAILKSPFE